MAPPADNDRMEFKLREKFELYLKKQKRLH